MKKDCKVQINSSHDIIKALYSKDEETDDAVLDWKSICNPSQIKAIQLALSNQVSLIQGPPGTGKSYVGTILAKILVSSNLMQKKSPPLVVICYTNQALDTFLENLLDFTPKIVRIGGRSKSLKLEDHNLNSLKKYLSDTGSREKGIYQAIAALNQDIKDPDLTNANYEQLRSSIQHWHETYFRT